MYLYFPRFYLDFHYRHISPGRAMALTRDNAGIITECNQAADSQGVSEGMPVQTAYCLCPDLWIETWESKRAREALTKVTLGLSHYSASLAPDFPDGIYLEVGSMTRLLGPASDLKTQIHQHFSQQQMQVFISVTPFARASRLLARNQFNACLDQNQIVDALDKTPVESLPLKAAQMVTLKKSGICHIGELRQLAEADLAYRISPELPVELQRMYGEVYWHPQPESRPEPFEERREFEHDQGNVQALRIPLTQTLKNFCHYLQERHLGASRASFWILQRNHPPKHFPLCLAKADNSTESWTYQLQHNLSRSKLQGPAYGYYFVGRDLFPIEAETQSLIPGADKNSVDSTLINRLSTRLGAHHVKFVQLHADYRPEMQTRYSTTQLHATVPHHRFWLRPLWLLSSPHALSNWEYQLIEGPIRITTGWWSSEPAKRDYYIARHMTGSIHWLFRTPRNQWFWHGIYA